MKIHCQWPGHDFEDDDEFEDDPNELGGPTGEDESEPDEEESDNEKGGDG
jgi:hypothetical protein